MKYMLGIIFLAFSLFADTNYQYPPRDIMTRGILTLADLTLTSSDFSSNGPIPIEFSCEGQNHAPLLTWDGVAKTVVEFALTCEDPDAKGAEPFVHWIVYNIPGTAREISKQLKRAPTIIDGTHQGINSFGNSGYDGPCPPAKDEAHQYVFTLYALDTPLKLNAGATKKELLQAIKDQSTVVQTAQLIGTYKRKKYRAS